MKLPPNARVKRINRTALAGLNTFDDPVDILDQESSGASNVIYDNGTVGPRKGSLLHRSKPESETADPFQILVPTNSNGMDFMIVNYGLNFYLDDTINNQFIKINQTYTPATANEFYGYLSWNNGLGDDRFYFGNGFDDVAKWIPTLTTLKVAALSSDAVITLDNSSTLPSSGTVIVVNAGVPFVLTYNANNTTTGELSLAFPVGQNVPIGSSVTTEIVAVPGIPKGRVFIKFQGRLFGANSDGFENTINYSYSGDPEDYTIDGSASTAGVDVIIEGKGGIISLENYGEYMLISKQDMQIKYTFQFTSDNSAFLAIPNTIISGDGIGPITKQSLLNYMNTQYYPTMAEGILKFTPSTTGGQTSTGLEILSQKIQNLVTQTINFDNARTAGFNQKLYWTVAQPVLGIPETFNNLVLVYDQIRTAWTTYSGWNATDIKPVNNILYFLSQNDGGIYECNVDYQDAMDNEPVAYTAEFFTKRYDLDEPDVLMTPMYLYVQGNININTKLYVDILYNENGSLGKQIYIIDGGNTELVKNGLIGGLGYSALMVPLLGGIDLISMNLLNNTSFFRVYLQLSQALKPHNVTARFYSVDIGSQWGVSIHALITAPLDTIETYLVTGPTDTPPAP